jgi:hypothetical protein
MGGYGSGRHGGRPTTGSCYSLDVNRFNKGSALQEGVSCSISWSNDDGNNVASIGITARANEIELKYNQNDIPKTQTVPIDKTPCHFGSTRPWFRCPYCSRSVGKLYVARDGFACRKCYRLTYTSTRMDAIDRSWRSIRKLEAKLDENRSKPSGMHWWTYEQIKSQLVAAEIKQNRLFISEAARRFGPAFMM